MVITVFPVFRLLTDFVCLYTYEFWLSLWKIVRSSVILLLPLLCSWWRLFAHSFNFQFLENKCYTEGAMKNGQSRETGNKWYTSRGQTKQNNNTICVRHHCTQTNTNNVRRVWWYQRGNQNPYIEEEQATQWSKEKWQGQTTIYKTYISN